MNIQITPNHWESAFFSRRIGRVEFVSTPMVQPDFSAFDLLQAKVPAEQLSQITYLQQQGFQWVEGEIAVELTIRNSVVKNSDSLILPADSQTAPALEELFAHAFPLSRFRPPYFSSMENQAFYRHWAQQAIAAKFDNICWVAQTADGKIQGAITLKIMKNEAKVGLLAVAEDFRRQGIATLLLQHSLAWLKTQHIQRLLITTQLSNSSAIACYQALGATIYSLNYWFYR